VGEVFFLGKGERVRSALVTGGAGFIGSHVADALAERGVAVRIFDNFATGRRENLSPSRPLEVVEGDVTDLASLEEAAEGMDAVFHLAALPSVARSVEDPLGTDRVNVRGTLNALLAARNARVRRFVFASSSSVYGSRREPPMREEAELDPDSPYGASKAAGELYSRTFARVYGTPTVNLRFFNVFGPRQRGDSPYSGVIARFAKALLDGVPPVLEGDGLQTRDFTYVEDVVRAALLAAGKDLAPGTVLNVARGGEVSVRDVLQTLRELTGSTVETVQAPRRVGDIRRSRASVERARALLGFEPRVSLREGLEQTLEWYRSRRVPA
jgi:UDP-glucose 4-epimerase